MGTVPPPDVLRQIIPRLTLWDARAMQLAHPLFVPLVHECVSAAVQHAIKVPRPKLVDTFMRLPARFTERVHNEFVCMRTPRDLRIMATYDEVTTTLAVVGCTARIELLACDSSPRPTFETLEHTLAAMWWFAQAVKAQGIKTVELVTKAQKHRPVCEVLNVMAHAFAKEHIMPLFTE